MLEINRLNVFYGMAHALKDASLTVNKGEIVALIGNNGAGKTTLLNAVSGLVQSKSGEIVFEGTDITGMRADAIVGLGIVQIPEGRRVFPNLTVHENLRVGAFSRGRADLSDDYDRAYAMFPILEERAKQQAGTLSGGEQQMLALARGLMARPRLLMMDEPSLGLAPVLVESIYDTIRQIHDQGTPILLVEQNAFVALFTANRAYVLETGRVVLSGEATALMERDEVRRAYLGGI
jgi:branched-chain amino acid transport system ATP-binding protein